MGFSYKSDDKRSDKETQSPVFRIFKEMIQREQRDPEKHNLLKEKPERIKKKSHSSRSKSDQKTYDSSSGDRAKMKSMKKMADQNIQQKENWAYNQVGTQNIPLQNEKQDSWWLWKDAEKTKKKDTDSCSCVTCPLKKLVSSDYACASCLVVLFLVSVAIVFVVVFRTMPLTLEAPDAGFQVKRQLGAAGRSGRPERNIWSADLSNRFGSYTGLFGSGYGDSGFQDSNLVDEGKMSSDLASVIDAEKMNNAQSSEKLREFYKKLLQTDAQIKKLKKDFDSKSVISSELNNFNIPDRYKRSLKSTKPKYVLARKLPKNKRGKLKQFTTFNGGSESKRLRRNGQFDYPEGFMIEKKKVLIKYRPMDKKRQFPKCSHTPKESKTHEKHLKHPFYQNSQRLDELLDHIMDKNVPEIMNNPVQFEVLFSNKGKCNHKTVEKTDTFNSNVLNESILRDKVTTIPKISIDNGQAAIQNFNLGSKDQIDSKNVPSLNQHTQTVTLFDKALDNNNMHYDALGKVPSENNEKYLTDHSSKFMAKIHKINSPTSMKGIFEEKDTKHNILSSGVDYDHYKHLYDQNFDQSIQIHKVNSPISTEGLFEDKTNKYNNMSPEINHDHYKNLYDQNVDQNIDSNQIIHYNNMDRNKIENINFKYMPPDRFLNIMIDDTTTEKKFDIDLDYNEILLSNSSQQDSTHETKIISTDKNKNDNIEEWNNRNHIRKLLQIDEEDDDTLGYEDLEEVLADEIEVHDESENGLSRKKRNDNVPDVYNRNWKGPIPLYPDELNAIIKQAAIENIKTPTNNKELSEIDKTSLIGNEISDTDYIEDYFDNKYDRLVELALAYSDYGVLSGKKEVTSQNNDKTTAGNTHDSALDKTGFFHGGFFTRPRKGTTTPSEGLRFEIKPGNCSEDVDMVKTIQEHFKITKDNKCPHKPTDLSDVHSHLHSLLDSTPNPLDKNKVTQKLDNPAVDESVIHKRSLKSIEYVDIDDSDRNYKAIGVKDANDNELLIDKSANEFRAERTIKKVDSNQFATNRNVNSGNNTMGVSKFVAVVWDWYNTLAKWSGDTVINGISSSSELRNSTKDASSKDDKSREIVNQIYGSDMIDNTGHRSRALLSIEDKNVSVSQIDTKNKHDNNGNEENKRNTSAIKTNTSTPNSLTVNITKANLEDSKDNVKMDAINKNKTVLKRSISKDDNLILWNDIYDDEYGVKVDYFEKPVRGKHSVKNDNFVKKSRNWFKGKVKGIADKFRSTNTDKGHSVTERSRTTSSSTDSVVSKMISAPKSSNRLGKRRIRNIFSEEDTIDFAALTANMKKVVREAANAVKSMRNLKELTKKEKKENSNLFIVFNDPNEEKSSQKYILGIRQFVSAMLPLARENSQEESMASSLMQQLIRLMTDVVDFQVQQKTCAKLPPDLQKYLEWLMSPSEKASPDMYSTSASNNGYDTSKYYGKSTDDIVGVEMPEDRLDDRTQCLGSIQAVQELMRQYDEMTDEDKSKMTGVKQYLEKQLDFLNKKAALLEEYNTYKYYKKRETPYRMYLNLSQLRNGRKKDRRIKRGIHKFVKNYGKKHTSTTVSGLEVTDSKTSEI